MRNNGEVSRTALTAAAARAAHLMVDDQPTIFADTPAYALLGDHAEELTAYHKVHGAHPILAAARATATTRSRYTEDRLAEAVRRGVGQYVILGAGLDSYAYRAGEDGPVRVFEVDHPATGQWKRDALAKAGIGVPGTVAFVAVDFENDSPADRLVQEGFDPSAPAVVSWLGVTMYLARETIGRTLAMVGGFASGSELVIDSMLPEGLRDEEAQAYVDAVLPVVAESGEPWLTFLGPGDMSAILREHGLEVLAHAHEREAIDAALWNRTDALRPSSLSLLTHARVP
ncbi:SAM-dependent methyltransferase [Sphaerisporangium album]|uniref:S-adenosyl-L-methionine-dependent methyltransferase n=1 Tax=Sphaerisporangium album TaxID=509200 RepID=A0A367FJW5_9ACTN|nr:class I SAM-dependent methyltransferase [Sphaerisporangium album]RCG30189.1 SAM-dependent methyltransferase [Sphaerisporangium album]